MQLLSLARWSAYPDFVSFLIVIYLLIPDFDSDQVPVQLFTTPLVLITTRDNVIADRL
jgi:hypothetical protein